MPKYVNADALSKNFEKYAESGQANIEEFTEYMTMLYAQPTIDIPIGVAIVVHEDGTVSKLAGVRV